VWQREPVSCYFTDFENFLKLAYPVYINLTEEHRSVYRNYVTNINPELEIQDDKVIFSESVLFCLPNPEKIIF